MTNTFHHPSYSWLVLAALGLAACAQTEARPYDGPQVVIRSSKGEIRGVQDASPEALARRRAITARPTPENEEPQNANAFAAPTPGGAQGINGRWVGRNRGPGAVGFDLRGARDPDNGRRLVSPADQNRKRALDEGRGLRFRKSGYAYDSATCTIAPRYEFTGVNGPNEAERAAARRLRPEVKIELPEVGSTQGGGQSKPKPLPEPIPVEDMLVSAGG